MSEKDTKKPETKETCEEAGGTWNSETSTCTLPQKEAPKGLLQETVALFEDFKKQVRAMIKAELKPTIEEEVNNFRKDFIDSIRKSTGLEPNAPVTAEELPALFVKAINEHPEIIRKALLENQENRSPTGDPLKKGNPDGTAKKDSFDEAVERKFEEMS